ncbi:hypothetical protein [Clostridium baratii]|uniref:hypothetical protein n=1 Tax=Clostridium baratii TaxID=1561 RepID=UPI003D34C43A
MNSSIFLRIIQYIYPVLVSILSLWLISCFNIIEYLNIFPKDKRFDICLALYLTVIQILINIIDNHIKNVINKNISEIQVIFYKNRENKNININPIVNLNREVGVGQIRCELNINGNTKNLKNTKLAISLPNWVTTQLTLRECTVQDFENYSTIYINLNDLVIGEIADNLKMDFEIPIIINNMDSNRENIIKCDFEKIDGNVKNIFCSEKYISNSFKLVTEINN